MATEDETRLRWRPILHLEEVEFIKLDAPLPFSHFDHFTVFWHGQATADDLSTFVRQAPSQPNDQIRTLFFFPNSRLYLPPYSLKLAGGPVQNMEENITRVYGLPRFLRYEIYPFEGLSNDLQQTRYTIWASITTPERIRGDHGNIQTEVGLFTTFHEFNTYHYDGPLVSLIYQTVRPPLETESVWSLLKQLRELLIGKVKS